MTHVLDMVWPGVPALSLLIAGAVNALWAIRRTLIDMHNAPRDPARAFALLRGFRRAMIGLCVMALGIGWYWHLPAVVGLALIICCEETLESSTMIAAIKHESRGDTPLPDGSGLG
jgi:hypothetical protein